jgi:ligand-binding SRPBCC domain-containing protein
MNAAELTGLKLKVFERRSFFRATMQQMIAFHEDPRALRRLTPPMIVMQCLNDERTSLTAGDLEFRLWFGPIRGHWQARHEPGPTETSFADRMLAGPMAYWRHEHIFTSLPGGVELTDRITFAHKPGRAGWFTHLLFSHWSLQALFLYRHLRTRWGLKGGSLKNENLSSNS